MGILSSCHIPGVNQPFFGRQPYVFITSRRLYFINDAACGLVTI